MNCTVDADRSTSYAVISAVSELEDCPITDLPPLYETLDPDALDALVCPERDRPPQFEGSVSFGYSDSHVTVRSGQSVTPTTEDGLRDRSHP